MVSSARHEQLAQQADTLVAAGDVSGAVACLKEAVAFEPAFFRGWLRLAKLLFETKAYRDAMAAVQSAEQVDPLQPDFQIVQGHIQARRFVEARAAANAMLGKEPGHPRAVFTLAHLAQARGDFEGAVKALDYGLDLVPANQILRKMRVEALERSGAYRRAVETAEQLAEIDETPETLWTLISVLLRYGQNDRVLEACSRAEAQSGTNDLALSEINLVRGQVYRILGDREKSVAGFKASLSQNPLNAASWWGLADTKTYAFSGADRQAIQSLLEHSQTGAEQKRYAAFALAKASEAAGDWHASMSLYREANGYRTGAGFDPAQFHAAATRLTRAMSPAALEVQAAPTPSGPVPIFILGLPRSGSTLLEQILASHSEIEGTMEQPVLPSVKRKAHALCAGRYGGDYLSRLELLTPEDLAQLGQAYLDEGALFRRGDRRFFTDKLPFNFEHIGLIHKILPQAVIIDARRNPLDCGFSLFKQHFTQGSDFNADLGHIGDYYNGYLKIMDHWDAVLPGQVLHVQYEDLVREPQRLIRQVLDHVGVPFEEACLNFNETDRAVRTASSEQVRQPLYRGSVGLWRAVEPELEPLKQSLGEAALKRFEAYLTD